jgi:hypothetical protein
VLIFFLFLKLSKIDISGNLRFLRFRRRERGGVIGVLR